MKAGDIVVREAYIQGNENHPECWIGVVLNPTDVIYFSGMRENFTPEEIQGDYIRPIEKEELHWLSTVGEQKLQKPKSIFETEQMVVWLGGTDEGYSPSLDNIRVVSDNSLVDLEGDIIVRDIAKDETYYVEHYRALTDEEKDVLRYLKSVKLVK